MDVISVLLLVLVVAGDLWAVRWVLLRCSLVSTFSNLLFCRCYVLLILLRKKMCLRTSLRRIMMVRSHCWFEDFSRILDLTYSPEVDNLVGLRNNSGELEKIVSIVGAFLDSSRSKFSFLMLRFVKLIAIKLSHWCNILGKFRFSAQKGWRIFVRVLFTHLKELMDKEVANIKGHLDLHLFGYKITYSHTNWKYIV